MKKQKNKYNFYTLDMNDCVYKLYPSSVIHSMLLDVMIKGKQTGEWDNLLAMLDREIMEVNYES